eukprot:TRINITY_DN60898_c0_g1_i1.p1 TRINITY_DN60898_c0_g1~~TRINITY_DN60898_c0_g1_i1.p1  ORF type:complete len:542 (-),score=99.18 TRINITY_DN60898_c0_g1_i1:71-1696(-)
MSSSRPLAQSRLIEELAIAEQKEKLAEVEAEKVRRAARRSEYSRQRQLELSERNEELQTAAATLRTMGSIREAEIRAEVEARAERAQRQRQEARSAIARSANEVLSARRRDVEDVKNFRAQQLSKHLSQGMHDPLDHDKLMHVSKLMNEALPRVFRDPAETKAWVKLFRQVDVDDSGLINYEELNHVVRDILHLTPAAFPEDSMQRLWRSLDANSSGLISIGEFGAFMNMGGRPSPFVGPTASRACVAAECSRIGVEVRDVTRAELTNMKASRDAKFQERHQAVVAQRQALQPAVTAATARVLNERRGAADSIRSDRDDRCHNQLREGPLASPETQRLVAVRLNEATAKLGVPWARLFHFLDDDESGLISFDELKRATRFVLSIPSSQVSDADLQAVWRILDADNSGNISVAEFGAFMRLGDHIHAAARKQKQEMHEAAQSALKAEVRSEHNAITTEVAEARAALAIAVKERGEMVRAERREAARLAREAAQEHWRHKAESSRKEANLTAAQILANVGEAKQRARKAHIEATSLSRLLVAT